MSSFECFVKYLPPPGLVVFLLVALLACFALATLELLLVVLWLFIMVSYHCL